FRHTTRRMSGAGPRPFAAKRRRRPRTRRLWPRSWCSLPGEGQREVEGGSAAGVRTGPDAAAVRLDDGFADGQAHSHASGFGGEEGVEYPADLPRIETNA